MELQEQDSKAFEEIVSILQCHPEIEKFELAKEPIGFCYCTVFVIARA